MPFSGHGIFPKSEQPRMKAASVNMHRFRARANIM